MTEKRFVVVATVAVVSVVVLLAILRGPAGAGALNPASPEPDGSLALARLLTERGTAVTATRSLDAAVRAGPRATLLVLNTGLLSQAAAERIATTAAQRIVIVGTGGAALTLLPAEAAPVPSERESLPPDCDLPAARSAGNARFEGPLLSGPKPGCYPNGSAAGLRYTDGRVALADGSPLMNRNLDEVGNAALSLNLLGQSSELVWYQPDFADPALAAGAERRDPTDLLPGWTLWVLLQLLLAALVLALWRGRRLGPVISEPLPVMVPAGETEAGRARLMKHHGASGDAAAALRTRARRDLSAVCRTETASGSLVDTVAFLTGRRPAEVTGLLETDPIGNDRDLVVLADMLAALVREVREVRST